MTRKSASARVSAPGCSTVAVVEATTDDPAEQLVAFLRHLELATEEAATAQPGCLFVSFIYETHLSGDATHELIRASVRHWRDRLLAKVAAAALAHPPVIPVDLPSLADQVFTIIEGGFILSRAMGQPGHLPAQLAHLRHYLSLLFDRSRPGVRLTTFDAGATTL